MLSLSFKSPKPIVIRHKNKKPWVPPVLKPKPIRKNQISTQAGPMPEWMNSVEWVGQSIVYFTIFYCSMNWIYYRNTRLDVEKIMEEKKSKSTKKDNDDKSV